MKLSVLLRTLFFLSACVPALASTYQVSGSGRYGSVPTTPYTTLAGSYSFSLYLDSSPAIQQVYSTGFAPVLSGTSYTLNGVTTTPGLLVFFRSTQGGGGLSICFTSSDTCAGSDPSLLIVSAQLYSGDVNAPTLLPGSFTPIAELAFVNGGIHGFESSDLSKINITPVAVTPEPSGLMLLGTGFLSLFAAVRRRQV